MIKNVFVLIVVSGVNSNGLMVNFVLIGVMLQVDGMLKVDSMVFNGVLQNNLMGVVFLFNLKNGIGEQLMMNIMNYMKMNGLIVVCMIVFSNDLKNVVQQQMMLFNYVVQLMSQYQVQFIVFNMLMVMMNSNL